MDTAKKALWSGVRHLPLPERLQTLYWRHQGRSANLGPGGPKWKEIVTASSHTDGKGLMAGVTATRVFNSHIRATDEFTIRLADGGVGRAAPSYGESIGIHEDRSSTGTVGGLLTGSALLDMLTAEAVGREWDQAGWDGWLAEHFDRIGRNNASALSEAYWTAAEPVTTVRAKLPHLVLNIINGGEHAYTNPVLSDFQEFCLVPVERDPEPVLAAFTEVAARVRERLAGAERVLVNDNPVHLLGVRDNRAALELLLDVLDRTGYADDFGLYIDAAAGDLRDGDGYRYDITGAGHLGSGELVGYWERLVTDYPISWLEDPLHEEDHDAWAALTRAIGDRCHVIGDNYYSTDADRIRTGGQRGVANAVLIKPNQAGTVTATRAAVAAARETGQLPITSHRSISTESVLLSRITMTERIDYIKIGPLLTDYSSVLRLNELIRLKET
jgi:enolase